MWEMPSSEVAAAHASETALASFSMRASFTPAAFSMSIAACGRTESIRNTAFVWKTSRPSYACQSTPAQSVE